MQDNKPDSSLVVADKTPAAVTVQLAIVPQITNIEPVVILEGKIPSALPDHTDLFKLPYPTRGQLDLSVTFLLYLGTMKALLHWMH